MKVNSTGLGRTVMEANIESIMTKITDNKIPGQYRGKDGTYLILSIEAVKPVHWTIRVTIDGRDLRQLIMKALRPKVLFRTLSILIRGTRLD